MRKSEGSANASVRRSRKTHFSSVYSAVDLINPSQDHRQKIVCALPAEVRQLLKNTIISDIVNDMLLLPVLMTEPRSDKHVLVYTQTISFSTWSVNEKNRENELVYAIL